VLAQLRSEFPDVTISKIRFLESEGLVCPARTASGYRQFSPADVARLRFVLAAQRDHYLPLKVIKEQLDSPAGPAVSADGHAVDAAGAIAPTDLVAQSKQAKPAQPECGPAGGSGLTGAAGPRAADFAPGAEIRLTREEMLAESGVDAALLAELERYGLVRPGAAGFYDPDAVLVARTARMLTDFGVEPRHLRAFRSSADREIGLLEQIVAPMYRQRDPDARSRADETARELAALSVTLHTLLVKVGLRAAIGS
jgi:DNA-binding transcriptional MerR regulator